MEQITPDKPFLECFSKLSPDSVPGELLAHLTGYSYAIDKPNRIMDIRLSFDAPQDGTALLALRNQIAALYALNACTLLPRYQAENMDESVYFSLLPFLCDSTNLFAAHFALQRMEVQGEVVNLYLQDGQTVLPRTALCEAELQRLIREVYARDVSVRLFAKDLDLTEYNAQTDTAQVVVEKAPVTLLSGFGERESVLSRPQGQKDCFCAGYYTFSLSDISLVYGRKLTQDVFATLRAIGEVKQNEQPQCVCGKLFSVDSRDSKKGTRTIVSLYLTDDAASLCVKVITTPAKARALAELPVGCALLVFGPVAPDDYDSGEPTCLASTVYEITLVKPTDDAAKKRIELHLHTQLSAMDALPSPQDVLQAAADYGHSAVAITDHGNVQAFPMAYQALKKIKNLPKDFKLIYGMEGYFVDDTARALFGDARADFETGSFVVFDLETTGLSPHNCGITEIGAVRFCGGKITDRFSTFVDPGMPVPPDITEKTGITDEMLQGAPKPGEAIRDFLAFAGDSILVAHNAPFDIGFVRKVCEHEKLPFANAYLDTLSLSRYLNSDLHSHKLNLIADYYELGEFRHHRAVDDTEMLAAILKKMFEKLRGEGVRDTDALTAAMASGSDPRQLPTRHIILLVKNEIGLKNLYKLVSFSYLDYFRYHPRIPKSVLNEYREGLLIGSACEAGELYTAIVEGKSYGDLLRIADFYDYFEIQPLENNAFLVREGRVENEAKLAAFNRTVLSIAKKQNKPCCATGDVHFLKPQDSVYRRILQAGMKFADADAQTPLYFRTTDQMLAAFPYLSDAEAREAVIEAPAKIAAQIEVIRPIPAGLYPPHIEGADEELQAVCYARARELFGENLPDLVRDRLEKELSPIIKHGFSVLYVAAKRLVQKSEDLGYLVASRGSVGSSFVATMLGITEVNPLPPYYLCGACKHCEFFTDGSVGSGFDLPERACPDCGAPMLHDGHNIPFETFLGFDGDKAPDIDLNFSGEVQAAAHRYTQELFGAENAFRAGTITGIADRTAFGFVKKYTETHNLSLTNAEIHRLAKGCENVKRSTGQHPGGIIVIPRDKEIYDFTPVQHPADKTDTDIVTTHFPYDYLHDTIYKLDILGHDVPTKYKMLEEYTGKSVLDVPMNDPAVMGLLLSPKPLGVRAEDIGFATGTLALPELGTGFVCGLLQKTKPRSFADLLQVSGLSHGTGVWLGNAEELVENKTCKVGEVIGTRDGIMVYLMQMGLDKKCAFDIMERVRKKDKFVSLEQENEMRAHGVPEWYIESCKKITYLFPKAHAAAYIVTALRLGWFKVHYPLEFYCAYFSAAPDGFDAEFAFLPTDELKRQVAALSVNGTKTTAKEADRQSAMQILIEMRLRGIELLPVDIKKSDAHKFLPEDGKLRLPLITMPGVGATAAQSIAETMQSGEVYSLQEMQKKSGVSKTVIEVLERNGALGEMPKTNQISLF